MERNIKPQGPLPCEETLCSSLVSGGQSPCPSLTPGLRGLLSMSHLKLSLMESWLLRAAFPHCGPQLTLSKGPTAGRRFSRAAEGGCESEGVGGLPLHPAKSWASELPSSHRCSLLYGSASWSPQPIGQRLLSSQDPGYHFVSFPAGHAADTGLSPREADSGTGSGTEGMSGDWRSWKG